MTIQQFNPDGLYDGSKSGLSQVVVDTSLGLVFVSGQVDWTVDGEPKSNDLVTQTRNALANLSLALAEVGASISNILQLRVYVRGELAAQMPELGPVLLGYLGDTRPAITGVGVASLAAPETLIEVEAMARTDAVIKDRV